MYPFVIHRLAVRLDTPQTAANSWARTPGGVCAVSISALAIGPRCAGIS
jgi:hypothetical protein